MPDNLAEAFATIVVAAPDCPHFILRRDHARGATRCPECAVFGRPTDRRPRRGTQA